MTGLDKNGIRYHNPNSRIRSCICDSSSEEDECNWCACCCTESEEDSGDCCPSNCCQGNSDQGCCPGNSGQGCCHGDSEDSSCGLCLPCKAVRDHCKERCCTGETESTGCELCLPCKVLRDHCKERFCSGESESTGCVLCKPCQFICDLCKQHCCYRDPEETCCVNCMGVVCNCWVCRLCGLVCAWIICCVDNEKPERHLKAFGENWELVFRPCDVFMCDCCPKCTQCHIMPFFCSREYPYCLDFCDCCKYCASLYDYLKISCVTSCNSATSDMCGCYFTECMMECCEVRSCFVCRCYTLKDCCNFCIEGINTRASEARNKPQCCQKFSWCCLELRWKGSEEQALKELAGDLCRRGYTLQVLDSLGTVIDPRFYREAIISQPQTTNDPSPTLGYTDSYGGYVNFPENKKKRSQHKLGIYTSTPTFGRNVSHTHNIPTRMTRSLPTDYRNTHEGHQEEAILYNEKLHGSGNITHISTPIASSTQQDSFFYPDDVARSYRSVYHEDPDQIFMNEEEFERESRIRIKLAKDRETEAKDNIKSNEQRIDTISNKLQNISDNRLDTSGLDTHYENLTHKLSQSGIYPKNYRMDSTSSTKIVGHGFTQKEKKSEVQGINTTPSVRFQINGEESVGRGINITPSVRFNMHGTHQEEETVDQGITDTPSRGTKRDIRKSLTRDFTSEHDGTQGGTLKIGNSMSGARTTCPQWASGSSTRHTVVLSDDKTESQVGLDTRSQSTHRHHKHSNKVRHEERDNMHRQSSKKVRIDTSVAQNTEPDTSLAQSVKQATVDFEDEVDTKATTKRHRKKRLCENKASDLSTTHPESSLAMNSDTRDRSSMQQETRYSSINDSRDPTTSQQDTTRFTNNGVRDRSTVQQETAQSANTDTAETRHTKKRENTPDGIDKKAHRKLHRKKRKKTLANDEFLPLSTGSQRKKKRLQDGTETRPLPLPPIGQKEDKDKSGSDKDKSHKQV